MEKVNMTTEQAPTSGQAESWGPFGAVQSGTHADSRTTRNFIMKLSAWFFDQCGITIMRNNS